MQTDHMQENPMGQLAGKIDPLTYIGGFFDGEGYIGMGRQPTTNGGTNILPSVRMSNTDRRPLVFIKKELEKLGLKCWSSEREGKRRSLRRKDGTYVKTIYDIGLSGKVQVERFISFVRPYVLVKGEQMDIVAQFINSRKKAMAGRGNRMGIGKAEYSQEEISLIDKLKALKH